MSIPNPTEEVKLPKITVVGIEKIKEYPQNAKTHPEKQIKKIEASIKEFGFNVPIVIDKDFNIIAGHGRILAARNLKIPKVPCILAEHLTKEQVKTYRLADNKIAESDWDFELLKIEFEELKHLGADLESTGFDMKEIDPLISTGKKGLNEAAEEEFVEVNAYERAKSKTKIKTGDVYILGDHRLMCGDSTKKSDVAILMQDEKADMIFTDPPYGIDYSGGRTQVVKDKAYGKIEGDRELDNSEFGNAIMTYMPNKGDCYICLSPINLLPILEKMETYDGIIVWKKNTPGLGYQWIRRYCEFIIFKSSRKKTKDEESEFDYWDISTDNKSDYQHGTQKPTELPQRAILFSSKEGMIVLDLFGGSGSTLIAAEKISRKCRMMEIDPVYCQVIIDRWEKYTSLKAQKIN